MKRKYHTMYLALSLFLAVFSQMSCDDERLWFPKSSMSEKMGESFSRSGNRYVGLRSNRLAQHAAEATLSHNQRLQVAKRLYEPGQLAYMMSPLSDQILEANEHLGSNYIQLTRPVGGECSAQPSTVQMTRQEVDPLSGRVLRTCRGSVRVNKCDGYCGSSVQPSIKSPIGLKKDCSCCNEGLFKQVRVRLNECYSASGQQLISQEEEPSRSYMDIIVDEPSECKCRRCDGFV